MPIADVDVPQSPGWHFKRLSEELVERRKRIDPLWERYKGRAPLPDLGSPGANQARQRVWKAFQRKARTNYAELIIASVLERLTPIGFRIGALPVFDPASTAPAAAPDPGADGADDRARYIWTANAMPTAAGDILEQMLVMGCSYAIVGAPNPAKDPNRPIITAEDPRFVITAHDAVDDTEVLAGLKLLYDDQIERDVAYLYLPGRVIRAERQGKAGVSELGRSRFRFNPDAWDIVSDKALPASLAATVPVVRFQNRGGEGEFEGHLDHLDRINHMLLQRIVIATLQAFRQRAVKGIPRTDPKTGKEVDYTDVFTNDPGSLWLLPQTAEMWESGQVDLTPILNSVKDDVRDLAAVMRLPVYQFMPDAANGSAEGASAMREGLVYRAEDRQTRGSTGFSATMSLAFRYLQDEARSNPLAITTLWRPIERFSLAERFDAAQKAKDILPWESICTDILQYEPDDIPRLRAQRADDSLLQAAATAPTPTRGIPAGTSARTEFTADTSTPSQPTSAGQAGTDTGGSSGEG